MRAAWYTTANHLIHLTRSRSSFIRVLVALLLLALSRNLIFRVLLLSTRSIIRAHTVNHLIRLTRSFA